MSNNPVFAVEVDYSGGFFTDVSTAVVEISTSRSIADPMSALSAGRAIVRLKNDDRRFNDSYTENLLTYSEQFNNAVWTKAQTSIAADATTAPDGTTTADKIVENTATALHRIHDSWSLDATVHYTFSIYLKAAERTQLAMFLFDAAATSYLEIVVNLSTGSITSWSGIGSAVRGDSSITAIDNGWYRVTFSGVPGAGSSIQWQMRLLDASGNQSYTGDGVSGMFLWGAQLNTGPTAKNYTPTTSAAVSSPVIPIGRPVRVRAENKNLLTASEEFDNAVWVKLNCTVSANVIAAPNDTATADKLIASAGSAEHAISENFTFTAGAQYRFSFYAKAAEYGFALFSVRSNGSDNGCWVNLSTGATSNAFGSVVVTTELVGGGWWRIKAEVPNGTGASSYVRINVASAAGVYVFTGDGSSGVYIWGAQLVEGSEPLDYVRTDGEANPTYDLFTGFIQSIGHNAELGNRFATYNCYDLIQTLNRAKIDSPVFTDTQVNSLVSAVCSLAGISSYTNIDTITDVVPYFWANNREAVGVLDELVRYGHYYMFVDGGGVFNFVDRNAYVTATAQQSYSEFYGLSTQYVEDKIFNEISISGQTRRQASGVGTLAWINNAITVPGSSSIQFWLQYVDPAAPTESAPAVGVVSPVSSSDYLMSSTTSGSGDLTSTASASISTFGESALCTVYNGGGGVAYLTKFQLRGYSLQKMPQIRQTTVNSASQATYGRKQFILDSALMHSTDYARGYADFVADKYKDAFPHISASPPKNMWPDTLTLEVGNLVSLTNSHLSVSSQYVIRQLSHSISTGGGIQHLLELDLEVARTGSYLILDDASLGVLDDRLLGF